MANVTDKKSPNGVCKNLLLEPFYGGSHKQLMDLLAREIPGCHLIGMSAKKWHWRARTSALYLAQVIPRSHEYQLVFASSVLNLAELNALRPDLASLEKIVYFHENQLVYPVRKQQERDFQYGYNQILSCLVADTVLFNSKYNMDSFLDSIQSFMKVLPDYRPKDLALEIRPKCKVLYFPIQFPSNSKPDVLPVCTSHCQRAANLTEYQSNCGGDSCESRTDSISWTRNVATKLPRSKPLHILWPHRWEHDKNPQLFFRMLDALVKQGLEFLVSVLGQVYREVPAVFEETRDKLKGHIVNWGYVEDKEDYYKILSSADVVVSTADHEFYGVAMLEAVYCGCYPLVPRRLVYPEIFPDECLYNTEGQLLKKLRKLCQRSDLVRHGDFKMDCFRYSWDGLRDQYMSVFIRNQSSGKSTVKQTVM